MDEDTIASNYVIFSIMMTKDEPEIDVSLKIEASQDDRKEFINQIARLLVLLSSDTIVDSAKKQIKSFLKEMGEKKLFKQIEEIVEEKLTEDLIPEYKPAIEPLDIFRNKR